MVDNMEWFNVFGLIFIAVIMIPNVVFAIKCKDGFDNKWNNKYVEVTEQVDNGILVRDNNWSSSHWNGKTYDRYDKKYDVIKEKFDLERVSDVLWLKFTDKDNKDGNDVTDTKSM